MGTCWLEITDEGGRQRRESLNRGLTRVGGRDGEIALAGSGGEQLHVYDQPPRMVYVGSGSPPLRDGEPFEETALSSGDRVEWKGARIVFRGPASEASLEEIPVIDDPPAATLPATGPGLAPGEVALSADEARAWRRLRAGLLVELGLADKQVARSWQDAVRRGEFDADACARELLAAERALGDPRRASERVIERTAMLARDLLMAPLLRGGRGATRKARQAVKGTVAMALSQLLALLVYSVIVLVMLLLLRHRGLEFDAFFDRILGPIAPDPPAAEPGD